MPGLLNDDRLQAVFDSWRRSLRLDPLLSRVAMPELRPFADGFNLALTGDDDSDALVTSCDSLVRNEIEPDTVIRITTLLAETFADEVGGVSGAVTKSLLSTLGHVCGLMSKTMVADVGREARRDALTALENRRAWDEAVSNDVSSGQGFVVALLDLDGLKAVNDGDGGHAAGDHYIKKFAADLARATPERASAYRYAGDEFTILGRGVHQQLIEDALIALQAKTDVAPFSFGLAAAPGDGASADDVVRIADERMYTMKTVHKAAMAQPPDLVPEADEERPASVS